MSGHAYTHAGTHAHTRTQILKHAERRTRVLSACSRTRAQQARCLAGCRRGYGEAAYWEAAVTLRCCWVERVAGMPSVHWRHVPDFRRYDEIPDGQLICLPSLLYYIAVILYYSTSSTACDPTVHWRRGLSSVPRLDADETADGDPCCWVERVAGMPSVHWGHVPDFRYEIPDGQLLLTLVAVLSLSYCTVILLVLVQVLCIGAVAC
jgi:hypothetical protein